MSLTEIKTTIENFIAQDDNDAIAINGKYGVGKTYYWRKLIEKASEKKPYYQFFTQGNGKDRKIGKPNYAYVSVFGIDSLDSLKINVFTEMVRSKEINSFSNRSDRIARNLGAKIQNIPGIQKFTGGLLSSLAFQTVRNALVCIDDIDRKSSKLEISEIIGLANLLKEQHNCKVVLILNEDRLKDEEKLNDEYKQYRKQIEKLVDFEIQFAPESEEVLMYVFEESLVGKSIIKNNIAFIKDCCRKLEIKNIRTLQKIRRYIEELSQYLEKLELEVIQSILKSLTLFVWSHYDNEGNAPSLKFIEGYSTVNLYIKKENREEISEEEVRQSNILSGYGYGSTDEIDDILMLFVKNGFIESETFKKQIEIKNNTIIQQQGENRYRQAWKLYHQSFDCNQEEFVERLFEGFRLNIDYLGIRNLDETVSMLRRLESDEYAETLIDEFVGKRFDNEAINLMKGRHMDYTSIQDAYLKQKLNEKIDNVQEIKTIKQVLENFSSSNASYYEDLNYLATLGEDDFYNYFKSFDTDSSDSETSFYRRELYYQVKNCLAYVGARDDPFKTVSLNAKKAVIRIALDCEINRQRVLSWFTKEISEEEIGQERLKLNELEH